MRQADAAGILFAARLHTTYTSDVPHALKSHPATVFLNEIQHNAVQQVTKRAERGGHERHQQR